MRDASVVRFKLSREMRAGLQVEDGQQRHVLTQRHESAITALSYLLSNFNWVVVASYN